MKFTQQFNPKAKLSFFIIALLSVLISCTSGSNKKQFKYAGGTVKFAIMNEPTSFIPQNVSDLYSAYVLNPVYESLVELNPKTLKVEPCIAKSWTMSDDGMTFKFQIRDDVYFHKCEAFPDGIKLTPQDVVYSVELACNSIDGKASYAYTSLYKGSLKGADDFFNKKADHISGISVDGNTVTFQLIHPDVNFVEKIAQPYASVVSQKVIEAGLEKELIGTGPFLFNGYQVDEQGRSEMIYIKNPDYYQVDEKGNQLPYLDSLIIVVENNSMQQLKMFDNKEIQFIQGVPPGRISMMLSNGRIKDFNGTPPQLILIRKPLLATQYYSLNLKKKIFQDVKVRKALSYAIDREEIVRNVLHNQAYGIGDGGLIPPAAFKGYDAESVKKHGYTFQLKKAKRLLAEAGYPNGKGFPTITITFNVGSIHSAVAEEISKQLKRVLNINVTLDGVHFDELISAASEGRGDIFRTSWYSDYYSPESFLRNVYGKSVPDNPNAPSKLNFSRYNNPKFDAIFEKAISTKDIVKQYEYFAKAEKIVMDDAPIIILWYDETIKIVYSKVRNMYFNQMNYFSFKMVYLKEWTKKEWEETHAKK